MDSASQILDRIAVALPINVSVQIHHLSTPPSPSPALFSPAPGGTEQKTYCESHFLAASTTNKDANNRKILVFAIEVLVFTTDISTMIFVSKADTSGYLPRHSRSPSQPSVARAITTAFLECLIRTRLSCPRIVLSLFARSQPQYLFPGSIENAAKHVLDDRQLIKWWCRAVDPIVQTLTHAEKCIPTLRTPHAHAHLIVPGCDKNEIKTLLPPAGQMPSNVQWKPTYPVEALATEPTAPLRCLIPRLPDDPKSRFLDDLDAAGVDKSGKWPSITTLDQFWEMMSHRQECSVGRLVGFIWVVFEQAGDWAIGGFDSLMVGEDATGNENNVPRIPMPHPYPVPEHAETPLPPQVDVEDLSNRSKAGSRTQDSPPSRPNHFRKVVSRRFTEDADLDQHYLTNGQASDVSWPSLTRGQLILDSVGYQTLLEHLLESDFSNPDVAAESSARWVEKAAKLGKVESWGSSVTGRNVTISMFPENAHQTTVIHTLTATKKKRKAEDNAAAAPDNSATSTPPMITKLQKLDDA